MPKIFSEAERDLVRRRLLDAGQESIIRQGLRKTKVEELTMTVGIAKGTFYNFFPSKEALCLALLEEAESARQAAIAGLLARGLPAADTMRELLLWGFRLARENSLMRVLLQRDEYRLLVRTLPAEALAAHQAEDEAEMRALFQHFGIQDDQVVRIGTAFIRSLFLLCLHENEIGPRLMPELEILYAGMAGDWVAKMLGGGYQEATHG